VIIGEHWERAMTADTSDPLACLPLNDDVFQAACISSAARLVAHGI
jgi:hypothetical protein